jgi:hypothetical protein
VRVSLGEARDKRHELSIVTLCNSKRINKFQDYTFLLFLINSKQIG